VTGDGVQQGEAGQAPSAEPAGEAGPAVAPRQRPEPGGGRRLLAATVTLPWATMYGITGAWAVARGARAFAAGSERLDVGYTRMVSPTELMFVGALLLAGFAVLLGCALLLLFQRRSAMVWLPVLLVAAGLTAGSVWASLSGDLHPVLWVVFFFGLAYVTVLALVRVVQTTRTSHRGRIARP
jgi:hypothetical protein